MMYSRSVEQYKKDRSTNSSNIKVKYTICRVIKKGQTVSDNLMAFGIVSDKW